jgi:DNA polymerase-3 subunit gamma/tau
MSYVVSARKYRPRRFEDVVGQEHITSTLKNALLSDKLAHAFLFCGPRGVGKTTCARLLAKVINMPDHKAALEDGSYAETDIDVSMNIIELDAASNNSVDNIRALTEQVRFQPQSGKYKVFIIDEVHMLSQAAFNAFLKTLEEPPPYAIFILATTEKHKILPTILSRCQLYDFRRIQISDIVQQLEQISLLEGIQAEHDALYTIAEKADGAMRDALSIYDRIASASGGTLTYDNVVDNLNLLDHDSFFQAIDLILSEEGNELLLLLNNVLKNGFEGDTFMNGLCKHVRNLMYCKQEPTQEILQVSPKLKERYLQQSDAISYSTILNVLSLANQADVDYPKAKDKRLHIEIALLKICYASRQNTPISTQNTAPTEKKNKKIITPNSADSTPPQPEPKSDQPIVSQDPPAQDPPPEKVEITSQKSSNETTPKPPSSAAPKALKISSIDDYISRASESINAKSNTKKDVTQAEAEAVWTDYASSLESPTLQTILKNVLIKTDINGIKVLVPSSVAKEEIQQEVQLYGIVRAYFNRQDLRIEVEVDRSLFPDSEIKTQRKLTSAKDKYDHLINLNPVLDKLIDTLNLKPDQD